MTTQILEDNGRNETHSSPIEIAIDPISDEKAIEFHQDTNITAFSQELDASELSLGLYAQEDLLELASTEETNNPIGAVIEADVQEELVDSTIPDALANSDDSTVGSDSHEEFVEQMMTDVTDFNDVTVEALLQEALVEDRSIIDEVLDIGEEVISQVADVAADITDEILDADVTVLETDSSEVIISYDEQESSKVALELNIQEAPAEESIIISDILADSNDISGLDIQGEDTVEATVDTCFVDYIWSFFHNPFASSGFDDAASTEVGV